MTDPWRMLTLNNRQQPSTTVNNRQQPSTTVNNRQLAPDRKGVIVQCERGATG